MNGLSASLRTIDIHNHVYPDGTGRLDRGRARALLEGAGRLGIDRIAISRPLTDPCPTPDEVRRTNDIVFDALEMDARFVGFCFLNPGYGREAVEEMERCIVEGGMRGVKMYHQYTICDPAQAPVMERAAELGIPVLMHAGRVMDSGTRARQPNLSNAGHFVKAAEMFPETTLIQGHIGGGGDWEWNLRVLETRPGSYIDISGSVIDAGIVRRTVDAIGADRVLFATDGILEEGVGKLLDAALGEEEMRTICHDNAARLLGLDEEDSDV